MHAGCDTYETLAEWAGGKWWRVFTQVSLILLLWGTLCGGMGLVSEVGLVAVSQVLGAASSAEQRSPHPTCMLHGASSVCHSKLPLLPSSSSSESTAAAAAAASSLPTGSVAALLEDTQGLVSAGAPSALDSDGGASPSSGWLNERTVLAGIAVFVLFPLCLQRHMRQLERAATAGVAMVAVLAGEALNLLCIVSVAAWSCCFFSGAGKWICSGLQ